ncbi:hypothetical protein E6P07_05745 [Thermochromatium tepidum ATCC 43061]|uniref:Uncharacterized protein n=2 Tax=Thermochromatium tepidum TaxID=1050 RepID=A0A6I6EEE8_THETI|nr:hypothetical protein E6P07_05745 [Thermochromatium tepidum ATCC 43061]
MAQMVRVDKGPAARKPEVATAMRDLIRRVRAELPFAAPEAQVCTGVCQGCSRKLLEFLASELDGWEQQLEAGARPGLRELSQLMQTCRKVQRILIRNGLIAAGGEAPPGSRPVARLETA